MKYIEKTESYNQKGVVPLLAMPLVQPLVSQGLQKQFKNSYTAPIWTSVLFVLAACGGGGKGKPKVEVSNIDTASPTDVEVDETSIPNNNLPEFTIAPAVEVDKFYSTKDPDRFEGRDDVHSVSYEDSNGGVMVSLAASKDDNGYIVGHKGGFAEGDMLKDIKNLFGTSHADTLTGDEQSNGIFGLGWFDKIYGLDGDDFLFGGEGNDFIEGGADADVIDGGEGTDWSSYLSSVEGVNVSLANVKDEEGFVIGHEGGHAAGDRLKNIENLGGSNFDDILTGDHENNSLRGLDGDDILKGGRGNDYLLGEKGADTIDGGEGEDWSSYITSENEVTVSLANRRDADGYIVGHIGGDAEGDRLKNIENLSGSDFGDTLTGDDSDNILWGGKGEDRLTGRGGSDIFVIHDKEDGIDTITDFSGNEDKIRLTYNKGVLPESLEEAKITQERDSTGRDLIISFEGQGILILENYGASTEMLLEFDDFIFDNVGFDTL